MKKKSAIPSEGKKKNPYPKPGAIGGVLIREVIGLLRSHGVHLPLKDSHILIATSGGSDSTALAVLLARYGRRVVGDCQISLVHFNHRWRAEASDADEAHVESLARKLGLGFQRFQGKGAPEKDSGLSWENEARKERLEAFASFGEKSCILTAHHQDDLAETVLWRLCSGQMDTHGGGILVNNGPYLRPLLAIKKKDLEAFLQEEGESWRIDQSNQDRRFLRNQIRLDLVPILKIIFPNFIENLAKGALRAQLNTNVNSHSSEVLVLGVAFSILTKTIRANRRQIEALMKWVESSESDQDNHETARHGVNRKSFDLGSSWKVTREIVKEMSIKQISNSQGLRTKNRQGSRIKWVFEGPLKK